MSELCWFHELASAGKGPDWVFAASFTPGSAAPLSNIFRALAPHNFTYYRATHTHCPIHWGLCDYDLYVDDQHYQSVIAHLEDRPQENVYIYHTIQACNNEFQLVRGYGGNPDHHGAEETRCIHTLAQTPNLIMSAWKIYYGGLTYPYEDWMSGTTSAELLQYLDTQGSSDEK